MVSFHLSWPDPEIRASLSLKRVLKTQADVQRGFKALKQMTKMNYLHLHRPEEAIKTYRELLGYTKVRGLWLSHSLESLWRLDNSIRIS